MHSLKKVSAGILLIMLLLAVVSTGIAQSTDARVRFMHALPGVSSVDIYTNGQLTVSNLDFGQWTGYINVPSGNHTVSVTPTGITTVLWNQQVEIAADTATTFIASSINPLSFSAYEEDLSTLEFGNARLLLIHAVSDAPAGDVALANGDVIAGGIAYGDQFGTFDLPTAVYELAIVPAGSDVGSAIVPAQPYSLTANTLNMAVVYGTPSAPQVALLTTPTTGAADSGLVRFVHGVAGAPAVDIVVNDTVIAASLTFGQPTAHIPLPVGNHTVAIRAAGTSTNLDSISLTVDSGGAQTVVAIGELETLALEIFADDVSGVTPDTAVVRVLNALPGSDDASLMLDDGTSLASGIGFGDAAAVTTISPTRQNVTADISLGETRGELVAEDQVFYGGVYYNVLVLDGDAFTPPSILIAPTNIMQGLASAPGAETIVVTEGGDTSSEVVTAEPVDESPPPTEQVATPEPTEAPVVTTTETEGPTARVLIDADVNLQLRQYPSTEALSLGLAPSGSTLVVNGREGAPVYLESETPPADEEPFVDPAEGLEEDEDLVPEETWLNITFLTPDNGEITAWVNALYLEVRDEDGNLQRLADLPMIPNNQAGEAIATSITPPPVPEDRVSAIVTNLDVDVNLNVRRTPGTDGEVLARLPNGTVTEFVGLIDNEDLDWVFVIYRPAEGGTITGWVGALYIRYEYNGRDIDLEELEQRDLLEYVDADRRGEISAGASQAPVPTPDPLEDVYVAEVVLDSGSNLHLRVSPDSTSESLELIPSGTQLVVDGRTSNGEWVQVTFEGLSGWISSAYVVLTFNGDSVEITEIPIIGTDTDNNTDTESNDQSGS